MKNHSAKLAQNPQLAGSSAKNQPATGWRHPSSCPIGMKVQLMSRNNNEVYGLQVERGRWFVFDRTTRASNVNWQPKAWAPIPEWTGEVAE